MASKKLQKKVIGLTGPKGSGKGTVARYFAQHYGASTISGSDLLNEMLAVVGIERTRVNQINLVQALRKTFGSDVLGRAAQAALRRLPPNKQRLVVIDNIRPREDWDPWRSKTNTVLIAITAKPKIRFERLRKRGKTKEEKTLTYARFLNEEALPTETKTIQKTSRLANFTIDANGSRKNVYQQIDRIAAKLKLKRTQ
ncbi:MAG: AAA family ATPase [Patescibacteria group bacterium]|jgi:dephospho-CoA kinase